LPNCCFTSWLIEYIKGQAELHRTESLLDEYRRLLGENSVLYDERYLE